MNTQETKAAQPFPWTIDELAGHVLDVTRGHIFENPELPHHLAKAATERWFAFELAHELDKLLVPHGWVTLVERGATNSKASGGHVVLGNFDLLLVPRETGTFHYKDLEVVSDPWPSDAVAIEIKATHLGDPEQWHREALLLDLGYKKRCAEAVGRPCAKWLGLLLSTSGMWPEQNKKKRERKLWSRAREQEKRMDAGELRAVKPLVRLGEPVGRSVEYLDWRGKVWLEAYALAAN